MTVRQAEKAIRQVERDLAQAEKVQRKILAKLLGSSPTSPDDKE